MNCNGLNPADAVQCIQYNAAAAHYMAYLELLAGAGLVLGIILFTLHIKGKKRVNN